nr:tyrosine-type recombinase/integrase [Tardiphaga robiniae]
MGITRRKLPPHVERNVINGRVYYSFRVRRGDGKRIKLPDDPSSNEFMAAYAAALAGNAIKPVVIKPVERSINALITSYLQSTEFRDGLRETSKAGYRSRLEIIRREHGHRAVVGMTKDRIKEKILDPLGGKPGAALDTLKKMRILIRHAIEKKWLQLDPSLGIKRPKTREVRAWTDAELAAYECRWPLGTKQRTAYELMLNVGTARADVHRATWTQIDGDGFEYARQKTGIPVAVSMAKGLRAALDAAPRKHVTIINTEFGKPFTVDGFSGFMRDAITEAGLPIDCRPHGLRKTFGRLLADAGASAHDIMAALGHLSLKEAERYTREADRRRGGRRAIASLDDHKANRLSQTSFDRLGQQAKK